MSNARAVAKLVAEALDSGVENPYALGNYSQAFCKDVLDLYDPPDERGYDQKRGASPFLQTWGQAARPVRDNR